MGDRSKSVKTVVLFDIDGTLLDMRGAGRKSFVKALEHVFGWKDDLAYINFAGNTDLNVLQQVMSHKKCRMTAEQIRCFFERVPLELEREARQADLILYPGVDRLLQRLALDRRVLLGLVTGNIQACARIKLQQFNLHGHFVLGAYGDQFADRLEIAAHALRQVEQHLPSGGGVRAVFLVGDTPYDIAAARRIGAVAVAVATGKFDRPALEAAGADVVLPDLSDTDAVWELFGL